MAGEILAMVIEAGVTGAGVAGFFLHETTRTKRMNINEMDVRMVICFLLK
jgi:hypothetical protein